MTQHIVHTLNKYKRARNWSHHISTGVQSNEESFSLYSSGCPSIGGTGSLKTQINSMQRKSCDPLLFAHELELQRLQRQTLAKGLTYNLQL